jgi:hypothetical protein
MSRAAVLLAALSCAGCAAAPVPEPSAPATTLTVDRSPGTSDAAPEPSAPVVRQARRAARRFLAAYLAFTYGRTDRLPEGVATPALAQALNASPPAVPPTIATLTPRVRDLALEWSGADRATVVATIDDGERHYPVVVVIQRVAAGRFVVAELRP